MKILVLSEGVFERAYGQQRYEFNLLNNLFLLYPDISFRVILLNDYRIKEPFACLNKRIRFVFCRKKNKIA